MKNYDAIVIGAGPAGSTAARLLARDGASVLLLDKHRFPRDKPCGGGVTLRAASIQDIDLSPVIERTIHGARFSLRLGESFDRRYREPLTYMTQRRRLDEFLAERAAEAGADFHDGVPVREIDVAEAFKPPPGGRPITVRANGDAYRSRILIGADGANGICGEALGLRREYEEAVALEGNVEFPAGIPEEWKDYAALDLGGLAGGYGWVFPKGNHLNVGVGAWKYAGFTLRPKLAQLSRRYGFGADALTNLRGHHLPVRVPGSPIARGPVALVGDAAGLVDPLSGEGIHMAFASGRMAAEQALRVLAGEAPDMAGYQRRLDRSLQPELTVSRKLQELFNFAPPPYLAMMRRSEKFWLFFCHLIRGEMTYLDFTRMIGPMRLAVDFLAGLAERRRLSRVRALTPLLRTSR
ncbi:MAG TPA: geranylgeranyl reductase family protein [Dehalococcoidia bacterium]|nr:geranylgeranyl reductase family protein [Dehalococcoidia bacterium]